MRRFHSIDVLRGLAALGVVLWHWQHFSIGHGAYEPTAQPLYPALFLFYERGDQAVQLFFCISGFIFYWLYAQRVADGMPARDFALLRFARLYPLHVLTLFVVAVLQLMYSARAGGPFVYTFNDWRHFALNLVLANSWGLERGFSFNGPVWSISVEVLLYAAFFLVCRWLPRSAVLLLALSALGFGVVYRIDRPIGLGVGCFFMGCLTYVAYRRIAAMTRQRLIATVLGVAVTCLWIAVIVVIRFRIDLRPFGPVPRLFSMAVLYPLTILCLAVWETRRGSLGERLAFLGDTSYSIYLWHFPLQIVFAMLLSLEFLLTPWALLIFLASVLGVSMLSYRLFELPLQHAIRRRSGRKAGALKPA